MTFRTRLFIAFLIAVLLPMFGLAFFVRKEMTRRLSAQYERRVEALITVIEEDLSHESQLIAKAIAVVCESIADDNRFRRAAVDGDNSERRYLLDYAGNIMRLTGLSMLQIQDDFGRIISSGHFRNEFDRLEPNLPRLLRSTKNKAAIAEVRAPDEPFLALLGVGSVEIGQREFAVVAGKVIERRFLRQLARDAELDVSLYYPGGMLRGVSADIDTVRQSIRPQPLEGVIVRELTVPFIGSSREALGNARFRVTHDLEGLRELRASVDRWLVIALAAAVFLTVVIVGWLTSRISRPLVSLAHKTAQLDLDRLDVDFETTRRDEIGTLSRMLGAMTGRLRASMLLIKDAERRATVGELARQVNHDIKNGLTPIRNVFRHLTQLATTAPESLPETLAERRRTIDASITYLEDLASNYARLSPRRQRQPCDANEIVRGVVTDLRGSANVDVVMELSEGAVVQADPVSLRRIIENLVANAIESIESGPGRVTVATACSTTEEPRVRISVADTGKGMSDEERTKIFDDFYTTKATGTGLGLSIVRRLVMDLDGVVHVESRLGAGSRFVIDLPAISARTASPSERKP